MAGHIAAPLLSWRDDERVFSRCEERTRRSVHGRVAALCKGLSLVGDVGDRIAILALNTDTCLEGMLAATACGCIVCPLNWRWSVGEMKHAITLCEPRVLLYDPACMQHHAHVRMHTPRLLLISLGVAQHAPESVADASSLRPMPVARAPHNRHQLQSAEACPVPESGPYVGDAAPADTQRERSHARLSTAVHAAAESAESVSAEGLIERWGGTALELRLPPCGTAFICFTSGTTGRAKGVLVSHASLHVQSLAKLAMLGYRREDVYLHTAPLSHIGGISSALATLMAGASHVFLPRFTPATALDALERHAVTTTIAVPMMLGDMMRLAAVAPPRPPCTRLTSLLIGAGALDSATLAQAAAFFPSAKIVSAYGMTEAASSLTFDVLVQPNARAFSRGLGPAVERVWGVRVGPAAPGVQLAIDLAPLQGSEAHVGDGCRTGAPAARRDRAGAQTWGPAQSSGHGHVSSTCGDSVVTNAHGRAASHEHAAATPALANGAEPPRWDITPPGTSGRAEAAAACPSEPRGRGQAEAGARSPTTRPGCVGEVLSRGLHVTAGYWRDPEATRRAVASGGWLRTGDIGCFGADGALWLCGRVNDVIKSGGENVPAADVEATLLRVPGVCAAAVVGVPHPRYGQAVAAMLQLAPGSQDHAPWEHAPHRHANPGDLGHSAGRQALDDSLPHALGVEALWRVQEACVALGLAGFMVPRAVVVQSRPLPVNSMGKIAKADVRDVVMSVQPQLASKL